MAGQTIVNHLCSAVSILSLKKGPAQLRPLGCYGDRALKGQVSWEKLLLALRMMNSDPGA